MSDNNSVGRNFREGNPIDWGHITPPPGRDITHLMHFAPRSTEDLPAMTPPPAEEASESPSTSFNFEDVSLRKNVATIKADSLEFGYHVRRRPWESGNVHAPLIVTKSPEDGTLRPVKTLWQSNANIDDKILRRGAFSFVLNWIDRDEDEVRFGSESAPPVYPVFYTKEGYVYVPKKVLSTNHLYVEVKYVEFWGWSCQPTRSPPREFVYKSNVMTGLHAIKFPGQDAAPSLTNDRYSHCFQEEVKVLELLNMTGSSHFARLVGFPKHSGSGFLADCEWSRKRGYGWLPVLLGEKDKRSTYSLWKIFQCLAKACAVMAWGSEYPDFPVKGWDQIVHPDLGHDDVMVSQKLDRGHTCGGPGCIKIVDFRGALRLPASDVVNNPWKELDEALAQNGDSAKDKDEDKVPDPNTKVVHGWWTNVRAIGAMMKRAYEDPTAMRKRTRILFKEDIVVPDPELGVTDEASLSALAHLEQEAYWRRHVNKNRHQIPTARLERVIDACMAENPRDRITIPDLLLEITKGLRGVGDDAKPLHWEEDGQKLLIAQTHDRIRKLTTSGLYSRRDIGLRLHSAVCAEMDSLFKGRDSPVDLTKPPVKFKIRRDDRQKWDDVVRTPYINRHDEEGEVMHEKVDWEFETREVSVDSSSDEDPKERKYFSDHEIDYFVGTQLTGHRLERYMGRRPGNRDVS
ncbi:hypothetical protein CONLIGDRAFT_717959 [Coniochaeta ligniaria NRRL 30616]|uniref:Protein kinase domain-containing protein n=1 Tax=Coniochaeta ligniaria NRRL 30616 TaxID=1408157 RepID=A0A1J7J5C3_9PEZI|nr:hypothetical protein CONLIGDRAFT_717959 [Coniochaeta ligniaria NRRL 30616]